ncbi:unnamed protein product [Leuciscus chuanchicus]
MDAQLSGVDCQTVAPPSQPPYSVLACDRRVIIQLCERTRGNSATQLYKKLCEAHTEAWMRRSIHYLSVMEPFTSRGVVRRCTPPPKPPPVPQYVWLLLVYCHDILSRLDDVKARVTSIFGTVLKMDSTKKVTRKLAGTAAQTAAWATNVGNEHGQVLMKPEEMEKEAQAHVVSKGGDPGNHMLVLGCHSIQFEQLRYHRVQEEARARATQPGCEGEALVGFGDYKEATLKDLYNSKEKKHQTFVKWLRRKTPQPGTSMDAARKYILDRDKERSAEAAATPPPPTSSSSAPTTTSSGPSKVAASTALPPRKSIAPMFSALLGRRPMAPDEFQFLFLTDPDKGVFTPLLRLCVGREIFPRSPDELSRVFFINTQKRLFPHHPSIELFFVQSALDSGSMYNDTISSKMFLELHGGGLWFV